MSTTGYDTVQLAWGQIPEPVGGWQRDVEDRISGSRKAILNVPGAFQATAVEDSWGHELRVQASLPKVLWGHNIDTLEPHRVGAAVDALDAVVSDYWPQLPSVSCWVVRRVDCTANRDLQGIGGEPVVGAVLECMKGVRLRGRSPVVGDSGTSVSWPGRRGSFTRKVYSKFHETLNERAQGLLRVEVGAIGQQAVRRVLGASGERVVSFGDCLEDVAFPERVTAAFVGEVDRVIEGVGDLKWMRAFYLLKAQAEVGNKRKGGSGRAAQLLGYAFMASHVGWAALDLDRVTEYRVRRDLRGAGVEIGEIEWVGFDPMTVKEDMDPVGRALLGVVGGDAESV